MINQPSIGYTPIEDEIVVRVLTDVIPNLQEMYFRVRALQERWLANGMNEKVAAGLAAGTPIAGFAAEHWRDWGDSLNALLTFIDQPLPGAEGETRATVKQVLLRQYTRAE